MLEPKSKKTANTEPRDHTGGNSGRLDLTPEGGSAGSSFTNLSRFSASHARKLEAFKARLRKRGLPNPASEELPCGVLVSTVLLTRGYHALVSPEDLDLLVGYKWRAKVEVDGTVYAATSVKVGPGKYTSLLMHRLIKNAKPGQRIDHADGCGLHNWRTNLRPASNQQNVANQRPHRDKKTAKLKGVYRNKQGEWRAQIQVSGKKTNLGAFPDEESAGRAYDAAARDRFKEFARCNFAKPEPTV